MIHRISQYIEKEKLLHPNDKVLVALSGGADSVALLKMLIALNYPCEAAHCNFHLRDEESDRDEAFVRQLCHTLNIPLHVTHFNTKEYAIQKKISIEMAARELRYTWFGKLKEICSASAIAVAHHLDDSIETMLLNLIRGTGINGLLGIRPKNGDIIRPLLCLTRNEIIGYLQETGQDYVTDSTNLSDDFIRNKIRLKLLPIMEEINPSVKNSLTDTGKNLHESALIYNRYIEEGKVRVSNSTGIDIKCLQQETSPKALLFEILYPLGFNPGQIDDIYCSLNRQSGKQFTSNTGYRIIKDREMLLISQADLSESQVHTPPFELNMEEKERTSGFVIPRGKDIACLDADKIVHPITVRKWEYGDRFVPFGMKGTKLVSDYMTDKKFTLLQKEQQWILCSGSQIVWVIGERTDNRFRVDEKTRRLLIIRMIRK